MVAQRWEEFLADGEVTVLVAEEDGAAAGVAACRTEWLDASTCCRSGGTAASAGRCTTRCSRASAPAAATRCHLWVLEHNDRARRFYERLGWVENGSSRVVPFPPKPIDVGYSIAL